MSEINNLPVEQTSKQLEEVTITQEEQDEEFAEMTLLEHLEELRNRVLRAIIAIFLGTLACVPLSKEIFNYLMLPLFESLPKDSKMIYTSPHEAFFVYLKMALIAGIFLTLPFSFYQIWLFVKPGLYPEERKYIIPISICSALLFIAGGLFGYFVIFPYAYTFFMSFSDMHISPMISMKEGLSFAIRILIAFGLVFELPLVIFFLARLGVVTSNALKKYRKYAILIAFIVAAILTPPDAVTQVLMAGPLIILYEVGIWIAFLFGKEKKHRKKREEKTQLDLIEKHEGENNDNSSEDKEGD